MGVPDHLPGSKLEKQHLGMTSRLGDNSARQKVFKHKPKTLKQKGMMATPINAKSGDL